MARSTTYRQRTKHIVSRTSSFIIAEPHSHRKNLSLQLLLKANRGSLRLIRASHSFFPSLFLLFLIPFVLAPRSVAQELPPLPLIRLGNLYTPSQVAVSFGLSSAVIGYFGKAQGTLSEQWSDFTMHLAPDALTMVWITNVTNTWTLDFFVNYTLVVDQYVAFYAFGPDSLGNSMGPEAVPVHLIGQNVWLRFELRTIMSPKPPTEAALNAWQQSPESPYMQGQTVTNQRLTGVENWVKGSVALALIAIVLVLLTSRRRR